jgi:hypothetical protein
MSEYRCRGIVIAAQFLVKRDLDWIQQRTSFRPQTNGGAGAEKAPPVAAELGLRSLTAMSLL